LREKVLDKECSVDTRTETATKSRKLHRPKESTNYWKRGKVSDLTDGPKERQWRRHVQHERASATGGGGLWLKKQRLVVVEGRHVSGAKKQNTVDLTFKLPITEREEGR
jgi:hypothetical protein